ncbi:hypothetical protein [Roseibium aggregatum]|uniref:Penicillin-insensitive murein endopeptidase n=1 Tax=Roseibium aggregatum TaxID=187304 RepID=A0A926NUU3_9HYPH|nr:hypothetical protein [Roseibium aggregatum]MBD1544816.1 hypothetical protein [Roseibium aggregatum]
MLKTALRTAVHLGIVAVLTLLTQIGGLAYGVAWASRFWLFKRHRRSVAVLVGLFAVSYGFFWFAATKIAPLAGRVPIACLTASNAEPVEQSVLYCALNRNYVVPELARIVTDLAVHMDREFPGTETLVLDAGFPFIDGFPLLPHLSHRDGRKLDLAFYYRGTDGRYVPGVTKSPIGYWAFEEAPDGYATPCPDSQGWKTLRWDMRWFRVFNSDVQLDADRTGEALRWLTTAGRRAGLAKVLLEPHLKRTLRVNSDVIRFQGCRAARHDDHMHIQIGTR